MIVSLLNTCQLVALFLIASTVFDNGEFRDKPDASRRVMNQLMAPMLGQDFDNSNRNAILKVHDHVVDRLSQVRFYPMSSCAG